MEISAEPEPRAVTRGGVLVFGVLYLAVLWVGVWLGYVVQVGEEELTVLWLPTGVTFGALLLTRRVWWPALLLGSALVYVGYTWITDQLEVSRGEYVFFAAVGVAMMWAGAELWGWVRGRVSRLDRPIDVAWLFTVVLGVTAAGASVSVGIWKVWEPGIDYGHQMQQWWLSDALGCAVAVPWMLAVFGGRGREGAWRSSEWIEGAGVVMVLVATCLVFVVLPYRTASVLELPYLVYPVLIWGAMRCGLRLNATLLVLLSVLFVVQVWRGLGHYGYLEGTADAEAYENATLGVQVYLLVTCLAMLMLVAVVGQRRQAERELANKHRYMQVIGRTLRTTLWMMDAGSSKLLYLSEAFARLTGRDPATMLGREDAWEEIVHPEDRDLTRRSLAVMNERGWDDTQYRIVRCDGEVRWVRELSSAVVDEDGRIRQLVGCVEDVTHRHRAAEQHQMLIGELRESNARYEDFMRISREAVWRGEFDRPVPIDLPFEAFMQEGMAHGRLAECNDAFARMYGYDRPQDAVGTRLIDNFRLEDEFNLDYLRKFHAGGCRFFTAESRRPRHGPDGATGWFLTNFTGVVEDGHLVRIWGTLTDITELRRLGEQLRESQKMEAVGQLAGGVAHDFNNLLAVISAHAELVEDQASHVAGVEKSLGIVREAIDHAAGVSRSLMAFSKNLPADKRPTDLRLVIAQTQRLVERTLPSTVELIVELPGKGLPAVMGDSVQLQQVLLNLAINARDALPMAGGTIRIAAEAFVRRTTGGAPAGRGVRLVVADDGMGMTEAVRQRVFEPFFSTKGPEAGTGLGLSVVRGIVEDHGGSIAVFSRHRQGATFTIELPCAEEATPAKPAPASPHRSGAGLAARDPAVAADLPVLLGEDDPQIRAVIATALVARGYRVVQAGDGLALRQAYDDHTQTGQVFAAVVTDVDMPGRTGLDVLRELRREGCPTPAVVLTGSVELTLDPALDGPTVLINKPFSVAGLCRVVREQIAAAQEAGL